MYKIITLTILVLIAVSSNAQWGIGGSIQRSVERKTKKHFEDKGEKIGEEHAKKGINAGLNEADKGVNKLVSWEDEQLADEKTFIDTNFIEDSDIQWKRLWFVSGKDVVFYDKPFNFEEKKGVPSNWYAMKGTDKNIQVDRLDQGKSILVAGKGYLTPKVENVETDYLSDNFTIELDFMMPIVPFAKPFNILFYAKNKQKENNISPIKINQNKIWYKDSSGYYPIMANDENGMSNWYHLSISYNKGILQVFLNEKLMIAYDEEINPTGVTLDYYAISPIFFKNVLITNNQEPIIDQINSGVYATYDIDYLAYKDRLSGLSGSILSKISKQLTDNPDLKLDIDVYFSQFDKADENKKYGEAKTTAIAKSLLAMGVNITQINLTYRGSVEQKKGSSDNYKSEAVYFRKQ